MAEAPRQCYRNIANRNLIGIIDSITEREDGTKHVFTYATVDKDDNRIPNDEYRMSEYNLAEWVRIDDPALCNRLFPEPKPLAPGALPPRPKLGGGYRRRRRTHRKRHTRRRGTRARKH